MTVNLKDEAKISHQKRRSIPIYLKDAIGSKMKMSISSGQIAKANDILILFDEVQCGMGRTGRLFAHEWFDVNPDVMALAKGLGGGFPIGACLMTDAVANALGPGTHGSTFGGNPLASAVGNCVMDIVNNNSFLAEVEEKGKIFETKLFVTEFSELCKHTEYPNYCWWCFLPSVSTMTGFKIIEQSQ